MSDNWPVLITSGTEDLLRQRFVQEVVSSKQAEDWEVEEIDALEEGTVRDALEGSGLFSTRMKLAVVRNPHKADLDLLREHSKVKNPETVLLLEVDGTPNGRSKFGKWVKNDMVKRHKSFPKPKEWDAPAYAADFVVAEVERQGKTIESKWAQALVGRVGTDLGMLSFEVQKLVMLLGDEVTAIEPKHIRDTMAQITEASLAPITEALEVLDERRLSKALGRLRATTKTDPTIRVCRFLGGLVTRWVMSVYLTNMPPKVAAGELGLNPWYFENKVLPPAKRWGQRGTVRLVNVLASSERDVLRGALDPWSLLTVRLLTACQDYRVR